jgi:hypothetical protein
METALLVTRKLRTVRGVRAKKAMCAFSALFALCVGKMPGRQGENNLWLTVGVCGGCCLNLR